MTKKLEEAGLLVSGEADPKIEVVVTLTSPLMRTPAGDGNEAAAGGKTQDFNSSLSWQPELPRRRLSPLSKTFNVLIHKRSVGS